MRRLFAATLALGFMSAAALAQPYGYYSRPHSLVGTTLLKVTNHTATPIVSFVAVAHHSGLFSNWNSVHNMLPGGAVYPGQTVMVNFPSCYDDIHISTANGQQHDSYNVPVCGMTRYTIAGW